MKKSIGGLFVVLLGLTACNVEHYDDCDEEVDFEGDFGGSHSLPNKPSSGGKSSTGGAGASAGSTSGGSAPDGAAGEHSGVAGTGPVVMLPQPCDEENDCEPGFNCDLASQQCSPSDEETCGELESEAACTHRSDCTPIYAGTNCSCGQDCECKGGEPGCVCESFEFFVCEATPQ